MVFANLSTSKKNVDTGGNVTYENMYWKGAFVGDAFEPAKALRDGDKIDIVRGIISNRYDKSNKILYVDVRVFEYELSKVKDKDYQEIESESCPYESEEEIG